jgi:hypothetical protein
MVNDGKKYCHRADEHNPISVYQQQIEDLRANPASLRVILFLPMHLLAWFTKTWPQKNRKKLKHWFIKPANQVCENSRLIKDCGNSCSGNTVFTR